MNHRWLSCAAGVLLAGAAEAQATIIAPAPPPSHATAVADEFAELLALLDEMGRTFGDSRKFCAPDPGSVLAARLAVFERRFGLSPRAAAPWAVLQSRAGEVLAGAGDMGLPETGEIQDVSAEMDRYVLLDILGRADEAARILRGVQTLGADACIWCTRENSFVVNQRRSEEAERRGDAALALAFAGEAALDAPTISEESRSLPGEDILGARLGLLLLATGQLEAGLTRLQDLARTAPDSVGGRLARAELELRDASAGIGVARYLIGGGDGVLVAAVWRLDDPASLRWIAARRELDSPCWTVQLPATAFAEVRPNLEHALTEGHAAAIDALTLLHGLPGGAEPCVDAFLDGLADSRETKSTLAISTRERLRWMHGGGPELSTPVGYCNWSSLSEDWKRWRSTTGARARSAR